MKHRWFKYVWKYIIVLVIAMVIAPILPFFARTLPGKINNASGYGDEPRLPNWLNLFMTQDNSLWGDPAWKKMEPNHWEFRKHLYNYPGLQEYLGMLGWLWRNPAYGAAWGAFAYVPREGVEYTVREIPGGYRIDGTDGSFEKTTYGRFLKVRTGWILGNVEVGKRALFLLSIRFKSKV